MNQKQATIWAVISVILFPTFLAIPSWLPVFSVDPEWFGNGFICAIQAVLPVLSALFGFFVGWRIEKWRTSKLLDMSAEEAAGTIKNLNEEAASLRQEIDRIQGVLGMAPEKAAGLLNEKKQQQIKTLDRDEDELLSSSIGQQLLCLTAWNGHRNSKTIARKNSEIYALYGQEECKAATESGFIRLEPCGTDSARIMATPKLIELMQSRSDIFAKLIDLFVRLSDPEWERDWRSITFNEDGTFDLLDPKEKEEIDRTLLKFKKEYRNRPFWQRFLIQSLVYGEKLSMLGDQYEKFISEDFPDREAFIEIHQTAGNLYELKATETIKGIYIAIPDLFESVDPEPYIDEAPEHLSTDFSHLITCGGIEWYQRV